jgi:lysophospholipase L1-like esterase
MHLRWSAAVPYLGPCRSWTAALNRPIRSKVRRFLKVAVAVCSVGVALVAVEFLLLRGVLGYHGIREADVFAHDPELGWVLRPHLEAEASNLEFAYTIRTDALGMRTAGSEPRRQSTGPRLLVVGDSFAFGWGVSDDEMVSSRLQDELRTRGLPVSVLTAGVPGYSTDQEYLLWKRLDAQVDPAVVIVLMSSNDPPADNASAVSMGVATYSKPRFAVSNEGALAVGGTPVPDKQQVVPRTALEPVKGYARTFASYALAKRFRDARLTSTAAAVPTIPPDPPSLATTAAILGAFNRDVRAQGASLLVVLIPSPALGAPLAEICRAARIAFLDLTPAFAARDDPVFPYDGHWNAGGHQVAADAIAPVVRAIVK